MMSPCINEREWSGRVKQLARLYRRKYRVALGASLQDEDFEQECWIAWCKARDRFDADRGLSFSTLLSTCIRNHFETLRLTAARAKRSGACVAFGECGAPEEVEGKAADPERMTQMSELARRNFAKMDPRLRLIIQLLILPPDPRLRAEIEALNAKADLARAKGHGDRLPRELNLAMMSKLFGHQRASAYRMVEEYLEKAYD